MPKIDSSDDSHSEIEDPSSRRKQSKKMPQVLDEDEIMKDDEADIEEADEDAGEEYIVETIKDHQFDLNDGNKLKFLVKWKGYEKKSDMTWEPESNLRDGAIDILHEYYSRIGGRPTQPKKSRSSIKRGRDSLAGTPQTVDKESKKSKASAKKAYNSPAAEGPTIWSPPSGSWEDEINGVDTIENDLKDGLQVYLHWKNGRKTRHPIDKVYLKCPQRMLTFYENHLVFKEGGGGKAEITRGM
ncbi:MAG: hypothetical protein M1829_000592 [Trizodia sp. TS-e1964]|nr:MAG: hypothetical protein M1829_000592 [Trizodia sp. TS-e1964]